MKYSVDIIETNRCYVDVIAENETEAIEKAKEEYARGCDILSGTETEYMIR